MSEVEARTRAAARWPVRYQLLALALLPMLVLLPALLGWSFSRLNAHFNELLISKVNGDLTIARQYLNRIKENTAGTIRALGDSAAFRDALGQDDAGAVASFLETQRARLDLDFLYVVGLEEGVVASAPRAGHGRIRTDWPLISLAQEGEAPAVIDVFSSDELAAFAPEMARKANLDLVPTANAAHTDRLSETRGMVIQAATLFMRSDGRRAVLVGGVLLNNNLRFIDTINDLVYQKESLPSGSQGTATLFLDDVRISTNVRLFEGKRALGTRVSEAVRNLVLVEGKVWLGSAFVVSDWYVSAYEPIFDSRQNRVGMLYVGFLEAPFHRRKLLLLFGLVAAFALFSLATVPVFLRWARSIFEPLEQMTRTIALVETGDLDARTEIGGRQNEIGRVADHLDKLLDQVQERDRQLRRWNDELNRRVEERTRELQEANAKLEAATRQLILSEKLASIGEIAAGVAHEINNPMAVMLGNLEVARSVLGEQADEVKYELDLVEEQIHRVNEIVMKLLQFARPEEYAASSERLQPGAIISDSLPLIQHLLKKSNIRIERRDDSRRTIAMNRTELQQVLVNLMVNAIHAMPEGGRLSLNTCDRDVNGRAGVAIEVADTGVGIPGDVMAKIFDPFFTTKAREGTGLGLSISQMLINRQAGRISVESALSHGTTFTVWLPAA